jgi:hypothetical protein
LSSIFPEDLTKAGLFPEPGDNARIESEAMVCFIFIILTVQPSNIGNDII